jgi:alpha-mannosidase
LSLDAGAAHLCVRLVALDHAPDHRLRLVVATGLPESSVLADAAFGPVVRNALELSEAEQLSEHVVHSAPLHRWVARQAPHASTAIISDGLAEYEAMPDGSVAITIVRATGELSRANLIERPGHAGWPAPIPAAQGPGRVRANFAVRLDGPINVATIEACADDVLRPLVATTWRDAPQDMAAAVPIGIPGIQLRGDGVVASAIKPAEDGDGIVLRAINLREEPRDATWVVPCSGIEAELVRLDESALDNSNGVSLTQQGNTSVVRIAMRARGVSSVRVRFRSPEHLA